MNTRTTGSVCESGLIKDIDKRGFSKFQCLSELLANSVDASASEIIYNITKYNIELIDNGKGLDESSIKKMWALFNENHNEDKSMGISGLGAKASTKILSNNGKVYLKTCSKTKENDYVYYSVFIDWEKIINTGVYTDNILYANMTTEEMEEFKSKVKETGTILSFTRTDFIQNIIRSNFDTTVKSLFLHERFDIIFGKFQKIKIKINDETDKDYNNKTLNLYDYFYDEDINYYKGKSSDIIYCFKDNKNNLIFCWEKNEGEYYIFSKSGKGYSKTISRINISDSWETIGYFTILNGMRKNNNIMNENSPHHICKINLGKDLGNYDNTFFESKNRFDIIKNELSKMPIVRNNQIINFIALPSYKSSSSRADIKSLLKIVYLRTELQYETFSNHENVLDKIIGIQSNKNQLNTNNIPVPLIRLIEHIKKQKWDEIDTYFDTLVKKPEPLPKPVNPEPEPVNPEPEPEPVNPEPVNPEPVNPEPVNPEPEPKTILIKKKLEELSTKINNIISNIENYDIENISKIILTMNDCINSIE